MTNVMQLSNWQFADIQTTKQKLSTRGGGFENAEPAPVMQTSLPFLTVVIWLSNWQFIQNRAFALKFEVMGFLETLSTTLAYNFSLDSSQLSCTCWIDSLYRLKRWGWNSVSRGSWRCSVRHSHLNWALTDDKCLAAIKSKVCGYPNNEAEIEHLGWFENAEPGYCHANITSVSHSCHLAVKLTVYTEPSYRAEISGDGVLEDPEHHSGVPLLPWPLPTDMYLSNWQFIQIEAMEWKFGVKKFVRVLSTVLACKFSLDRCQMSCICQIESLRTFKRRGWNLAPGGVWERLAWSCHANFTPVSDSCHLAVKLTIYTEPSYGT